ncbi:hypothetical protein MAHJHV61_13500 [Mycobacterium avium subsp. hominissuis]
MITASWPVASTHNAASIVPAAGFSRARAASSASSDSASTDRRQSRACTDPASGTSNDQPSAPSSVTRNRSMACRSTNACNTIATSVSVTPAGACTRTVWLNWSVAPPARSAACSHRMIGVGGTGPTPSSATSAARSPEPTTRASRATVCSTKTSRGRHVSPAARARATTCSDKMLSPPSSKNDSSTPTRFTPSTSA